MDALLGDAEMKILCVIILFVLLLGPFRRLFFGQWRFNIPALIAGLTVLFLAGRLMRPEDSGWFPCALAPLVALGAGAAFKKWLDDVFGKEK